MTDVLTPVSSSAVYPESPRWKDGELWFSDVHDYALKKVSRDGVVERLCEVPSRPAGLGFLPDGRLLVATAKDKCLWTFDGDSLELCMDLSEMVTGLLNDMVVDGHGRAYVGDTGFNLMAGDEPAPGSILRVDVSGSGPVASRVVATGLDFPNGMALSGDGRRLWVAETRGPRVTRFAVSPEGDLLDRETVIELPDLVDGLCADAEDGVWVAVLRPGEFWRVASDGRVTRKISVAGQFAIACTLGGPDRRNLYLCSAVTTMEDLARGVSSGRIHSLRVDVPGAGWP
ncbi:SMP-30/gluconolactonase/LRE family protein [Amycolatopsis silviterrae]|uniref:SMP-30/gluconolactonase/LRE family protein n=1 Tax=Amycolatopsis silviterrae TaxID=1656914 RepID=A0ABW5HKF8_9PSEU